MRARLAPGVVDPRGAIASIRQLAGNTMNVGSAAQHPVDKRDAYVQWAIEAQGVLEGLLHRDDAEALFATSRHRDICSMPAGNQLTPLIYAELRAKSRAFEETAAYLQRHLDRMQSANGLPVVIDSNVLLQCLPLTQVDWRAVVKETARVMVPLRVLEEVDAKKYGDNLRLRGVARGVLSWLEGLLPDGETGPVSLNDGATIELLLADRPRYRPDDADEEILDVCDDVRHFVGKVRLLTADKGMRVRASSEGVAVLQIPKEWERRLAETDSV